MGPTDEPYDNTVRRKILRLCEFQAVRGCIDAAAIVIAIPVKRRSSPMKSPMI
jgi:hypothetical protein